MSYDRKLTFIGFAKQCKKCQWWSAHCQPTLHDLLCLVILGHVHDSIQNFLEYIGYTAATRTSASQLSYGHN